MSLQMLRPGLVPLFVAREDGEVGLGVTGYLMGLFRLHLEVQPIACAALLVDQKF